MKDDKQLASKPAGSSTSGMKTHVVFSAVFILLLALDQLTKHLAVTYLTDGDIPLIKNVLSLHYLENRGAAWGLLENAFWLFYIVTIVAVLIMGIIYAKIPFLRHYWFLRFLIVMLGAGAVGNFIDRAIHHYVVDFIYLDFINFPVFNVADIYVTVSVLLLVIAMLFIYNKDNLLWKKDSGE